MYEKCSCVSQLTYFESDSGSNMYLWCIWEVYREWEWKHEDCASFFLYTFMVSFETLGSSRELKLFASKAIKLGNVFFWGLVESLHFLACKMRVALDLQLSSCNSTLPSLWLTASPTLSFTYVTTTLCISHIQPLVFPASLHRSSALFLSPVSVSRAHQLFPESITGQASSYRRPRIYW